MADAVPTEAAEVDYNEQEVEAYYDDNDRPAEDSHGAAGAGAGASGFDEASASASAANGNGANGDAALMGETRPRSDGREGIVVNGIIPNVLFVSRFAAGTNKREVEELMSQFGATTAITVRDNIAFVDFANADDASRAKHELHHHPGLGSDSLIVDFKRDKPSNRGPRGGGSGRGAGGRGGAGAGAGGRDQQFRARRDQPQDRPRSRSRGRDRDRDRNVERPRSRSRSHSRSRSFDRPRDPRDFRDPRDQRDLRDVRDVRDVRDSRDLRDPRDRGYDRPRSRSRDRASSFDRPRDRFSGPPPHGSLPPSQAPPQHYYNDYARDEPPRHSDRGGRDYLPARGRSRDGPGLSGSAPGSSSGPSSGASASSNLSSSNSGSAVPPPPPPPQMPMPAQQRGRSRDAPRGYDDRGYDDRRGGYSPRDRYPPAYHEDRGYGRDSGNSGNHSNSSNSGGERRDSYRRDTRDDRRDYPSRPESRGRDRDRGNWDQPPAYPSQPDNYDDARFQKKRY